MAGEEGPPDVTIAALLHDVLVGDSDVTAQDLRARFGPDVARLVEASDVEDVEHPALQDRKGPAPPHGGSG